MAGNEIWAEVREANRESNNPMPSAFVKVNLTKNLLRLDLISIARQTRPASRTGSGETKTMFKLSRSDNPWILRIRWFRFSIKRERLRIPFTQERKNTTLLCC